MPEEQGISTGLYKAMVRQNLPYQGKVGSGGRASKLLMTNARPINNSGTEFFMEVDYLNVYHSADKTNVVRDNIQDKKLEAEQQFNRFKKEVTDSLLQNLEKWYRDMKMRVPQNLNVMEQFQYQREVESEYSRLQYMFGNKNAIFNKNTIPPGFFIDNKELIEKMEGFHSNVIKPRPADTLTQGKSDAQLFHEAIAKRDPLAYRMAQDPVIKGVAVGSLTIMGVSAIPALAKAAFNTSWSDMLIKGTISTTAQYSVNNGNYEKISPSAVVFDAVLKGYPGIIVGSAVDWNPFREDPIRTIGGDISNTEFGINVALSIIVGKYFSPVNESINNISEPVKKQMMSVYSNFLESVTTYGLSNEIDKMGDTDK